MDNLYLANGQCLDIITNAARKDGTHFNTPVCKGRIGNNIIYVLRNTGCSGVIVRDKFVQKD